MAEKKPDRVGAFLGLITTEGKVRYQMRIEEQSITGISYKGDFELPGGRVKEKDLKKVLTPEGLLKEAIRETKEELGLVVEKLMPQYLYRTIFENPKTGKVDWAFVIPVFPAFWDETAEVKRKIVDVNPDELEVLGKLNLIVSGKKRMYRMGQACLFLSHSKWRGRAAELLTEVKPDWRETEWLTDPNNDLAEIRRSLGLEGKLSPKRF